MDTAEQTAEDTPLNASERRAAGSAVRAARAVRAVLSDRPQLTSWVIVTLGLAVYLSIPGFRPQQADSNGYLLMSTAIHPPGLGNFGDPIRGYAFPMILAYASELTGLFTSQYTVYIRFVPLVALPLTTCVVAPTIARAVSATVAVTVPRLVALSALVAFSWRNDLLYALSDLPSLALFGGGVAILLRSKVWAVAIGGFCLGFAVICRPAYVVPMVAAIGLGFLLARGVRLNLARLGLSALGFLAALAPQMYVDAAHFGTLSPFPPNSGSSLTMLQLTDGLRYERYDTFIGEGQDLGRRLTPFAVLNDGNAADLRTEGHGVYSEKLDAGEYARWVASRPLSTTGLYLRHVLNGLDTRYGGTYLDRRTDDGPLVRLVNFVLLSAAIVVLGRRLWLRFRRRAVRWRSPTTWFAVLVVLVAAQASTTAVEARFFLPIQLVLFGCVALTFGPADWPRRAWERAALVAAPLALAGLWFLVAAPIPA